MGKYKGRSGWHKQTLRHSKAKRTGHAGGKYANSNPTGWRYPKDVFSDKKNKNLSFNQLQSKGVFLKYQGDTDKDGTKNIHDCRPLDAKKQGRLHEMHIQILHKMEEHQEQKRLAEMKKLENLKEKLQQANIKEEEKNKKINEKQAIINEIEAEKQKTKELREEHTKIRAELSKNRVDKKILNKSKEFLRKPSTKKAIRKGLKAIGKGFRDVFT